MKQWSKYVQNSEFLEKTRMFLLDPIWRVMIIDRMGIKSGMKILDVACGSGEFTFYLSNGLNGVSLTGIDLDDDFIKTAQDSVLTRNHHSDNEIRFEKGDALYLPYDDESFDIVVSHTFFNSVQNYRRAISEMKRVCKKCGVIAAICSMDYKMSVGSAGIYPKDANFWKQKYDELRPKIYEMIENVTPLSDYAQGIPTSLLPNLFVTSQLSEVSAYPLGHFFSLSNAAVSEDDKLRYINLDYESEIKRIDAIYEDDRAREMISEQEMREYKEALKNRRDYLLDKIGENNIWEWLGGGSLLVTGVRI